MFKKTLDNFEAKKKVRKTKRMISLVKNFSVFNWKMHIKRRGNSTEIVQKRRARNVFVLFS